MALTLDAFEELLYFHIFASLNTEKEFAWEYDFRIAVDYTSSGHIEINVTLN